MVDIHAGMCQEEVAISLNYCKTNGRHIANSKAGNLTSISIWKPLHVATSYLQTHYLKSHYFETFQCHQLGLGYCDYMHNGLKGRCEVTL